jgi:hypothetical protein
MLLSIGRLLLNQTYGPTPNINSSYPRQCFDLTRLPAINPKIIP